MTSVTAEQMGPSQSAKDFTAHPAFVPLVILLAVGLGIVLTSAGIVAVWQTGVIHDPDDAMRLVQVRALLAGQNWYDMTAYRLDPPGGGSMHWSRIVDIPLVVLMKAFGLFLPPDMAERAIRIAFPILLQAALYAAAARLAKSLLGRDAIVPMIFMVLLSGIAFGQFQPGRVDHHAPQIVLLAFMLGGLVEAVKSDRMMPAAVAGGLASLSMAISLENMPFILTLWGAAAGLWIWYGRTMRAPMQGFSTGLLIGLPLCFVATIGPSHWLASFPDAFSFGQLLAGTSGALVCLGLAFCPERFGLGSRLGLALAGAGLVLALTVLAAPGVLREPFADVDPLVRDIWLSNVHEAWSFRQLAQKEPDTAAMFMIPLLLAIASSLLAVIRESGRARLQWIVVAAASLMGLAMSLVLIRVMTSVGPIAPVGGVWAVMRLSKILAPAAGRATAVLTFLLLLPFSSIPWALAIGGDKADVNKPSGDCHASAAFTAFDALPPGLILAPIDAGSHLLAFTPHSVLAAPYHRNNHGNVVALQAFLASPEVSRAIVIESGAKYVAICSSLGETSVLSERNPQSLAKALVDGRVPDWLVPVSAVNTPYKIFTVSH